ncbi:unnamed protein product, partial [Vitis vinifera]|uniref:Uncharacterized protein n=1 Tax=Vitis vinifera TaxID=29760 RepID=D7SRS2_VITVI
MSEKTPLGERKSQTASSNEADTAKDVPVILIKPYWCSNQCYKQHGLVGLVEILNHGRLMDGRGSTIGFSEHQLSAQWDDIVVFNNLSLQQYEPVAKPWLRYIASVTELQYKGKRRSTALDSGTNHELY